MIESSGYYGQGREKSSNIHFRPNRPDMSFECKLQVQPGGSMDVSGLMEKWWIAGIVDIVELVISESVCSRNRSHRSACSHSCRLAVLGNEWVNSNHSFEINLTLYNWLNTICRSPVVAVAAHHSLDPSSSLLLPCPSRLPLPQMEKEEDCGSCLDGEDNSGDRCLISSWQLSYSTHEPNNPNGNSVLNNDPTSYAIT